jgi:CheY-like chemotaxis protein
VPPEPLLVYMVDDNSADIELVKMAFSEHGCDIPFVTAKNGDEALRYLRTLAADATTSRPGVVLLDLNMPRMGGIDVLTYISLQPQLRSIPVVILTTSDSPRDRETCLKLGANRYIVKSHSLDEFFASLKPVVEMLRPPPGGPPAQPPAAQPPGAPPAAGERPGRGQRISLLSSLLRLVARQSSR